VPAGRRELVLDVAAKLFTQNGYNATSIGDIAAGSGIAKPTLYHYFSSKTEILHEILSDYIESLITMAEQPDRAELAPPHALLQLMTDIIGTITTHRGQLQNFYENMDLLPAEEQRAVKVRRDHYSALFEEMLLEGQRQQAFAFDDVRITRLGIFGMCSWTYQWYRPGGELGTDEVAFQLWRLVMNGIGPRAEPAAAPPKRRRTRAAR
jgi:AcrR family transcriptional regulator